MGLFPLLNVGIRVDDVQGPPCLLPHLTTWLETGNFFFLTPELIRYKKKSNKISYDMWDFISQTSAVISTLLHKDY